MTKGSPLFGHNEDAEVVINNFYPVLGKGWRFGRGSENTVKPVLVATSINQAACIKQACFHFPKKANTWKCTYINCIKQSPVLNVGQQTTLLSCRASHGVNLYEVSKMNFNL